jgi:hypothetical protein
MNAYQRQREKQGQEYQQAREKARNINSAQKQGRNSRRVKNRPGISKAGRKDAGIRRPPKGYEDNSPSED